MESVHLQDLPDGVSPKERPPVGQDPNTRFWSVKGFLGTLQHLAIQPLAPATATSALPDAAPPGADQEHAFETLYKILVTDLEQHTILPIDINADGFHIGGRPISLGDHEHDIARLFHEDGVTHLVFQRGIEKEELSIVVNCLRRRIWNPNKRLHDMATLLWERSLEHVQHRTREADWPFTNWAWVRQVLKTPGIGVRTGRAYQPEEAPLHAAAFDNEFDVTSLWVAARRRRSHPPVDVPRSLIQQLAQISLQDPLEEARTTATDLLVELLRRQVEQAHFDMFCELMLWLGEQEGTGPAHALLVRALKGRVWDSTSLRRLGKRLDASELTVPEVRSVRDILLWLGENAIEPLCELFSELETPRARRLISLALTGIAANRPSKLVARVADKPWYIIRNTVYVLGRIGGVRVLPYLRQWTTHEDSRIRIEVARALAHVDHSHAIVLLTDMLRDPEYRVRQNAMWAMVRRNEPAVLSRLRRFLAEDKTFRSRPASERDDYFRAYGRLARERTIRELVRTLNRGSLMQRGWKLELRRGAAIALGESDHPKAREALEQQAESMNKSIRLACMHALEAMRQRARRDSDECVDAVLDTSWDDDDLVSAWEDARGV